MMDLISVFRCLMPQVMKTRKVAKSTCKCMMTNSTSVHCSKFVSAFSVCVLYTVCVQPAQTALNFSPSCVQENDVKQWKNEMNGKANAVLVL